MKDVKRVMAVFLSLLMTISLMPGMIFASTTPDDSGSQASLKAEVLTQAALDAATSGGAVITFTAIDNDSSGIDWQVDGENVTIATSLAALGVTVPGISTATVTSGDTIVITPVTSGSAFTEVDLDFEATPAAVGKLANELTNGGIITLTKTGSEWNTSPEDYGISPSSIYTSLSSIVISGHAINEILTGASVVLSGAGLITETTPVSISDPVTRTAGDNNTYTLTQSTVASIWAISENSLSTSIGGVNGSAYILTLTGISAAACVAVNGSITITRGAVVSAVGSAPAIKFLPTTDTAINAVSGEGIYTFEIQKDDSGSATTLAGIASTSTAGMNFSPDDLGLIADNLKDFDRVVLSGYTPATAVYKPAGAGEEEEGSGNGEGAGQTTDSVTVTDMKIDNKPTTLSALIKVPEGSATPDAIISATVNATSPEAVTSKYALTLTKNNNVVASNPAIDLTTSGVKIFVGFGDNGTIATKEGITTAYAFNASASALTAGAYTLTVSPEAANLKTASATITIGAVVLKEGEKSTVIYGLEKSKVTLPEPSVKTNSDGKAFSSWKDYNNNYYNSGKEVEINGTTVLDAFYAEYQVSTDTIAEVTTAGISNATTTEQAAAASIASIFTTSTTKPAIDGIDETIMNAVASNASINVSELKNKSTKFAKLNITPSAIVAPVMNIEIKDVTLSDPTSAAAIKTFTVDIKPMYQIYLTSESGIDLSEIDDANKEAVGSPAEISNENLKDASSGKYKSFTITVPLPDRLASNGSLNVKHIISGNPIYTGTVKDSILTFENPDGFSDFEIGVGIKAKISDKNYETLQDAVNNVKTGDTITLLEAPETTKPSISVTKSTTFKVTKADSISSTAISIQIKASGDGINVSPAGVTEITGEGVTFEVTKNSGSSSESGSTGGSSSGGSSSSSSKVSVPTKIDGGSISVSSKNPSKGDTVTITAKPNDGYKVDKITVTDKNGKTVEVTDAGDNKYTFVMPDTTVSISASFAKDDTATDENNNNNPSDTSGIAFTDVKSGDYYYDAVKWAVDNNVTNGLSATSFGPSASCTRAQTVTFMWRAAGSPAPQSANNPFTDVKQGSYYYDAVMWAVEQGITTGATATTFAPDATVTRAQFVTFEYRAAGSPEVTSDVSFGDVSSSAYYADAVKWAAANGITTGTSANAFSPSASCTRGQTVTFLYRYYAA